MIPKKKLLIAEAANPEWVSTPLIGWSLSTAISRATPAHIVTHIRNREAISRAGLREGEDFTAIDSDAVAKPLWRLSQWLRGGKSVSWTTSTAIGALSYYYFEHLLWKRFGGDITAGRYDVVHRITPTSPTVPSLIAAKCRAAGVPFILGPLNGGVPWPAGFDAARRKEREWLSYVRSAYKLLPGYRSTLDSSAAICAGSLDTLKQIPPRHHHKCIYLPENAIDPARFPLPAESASDGPLRACFVGRLVPYKGPDMLLEALAPLIRDARIRIDILGDGPMMPELQRIVEKEALSCGVTLHGWVEHQKVSALMRQSRLLVFPSIREFGGGVVLEAMALGLVPVVVDYGGPGELVVPGTGYKVPLGSRAAIVSALRDTVAGLCDKSGELDATARSARERALRLYTWEAKAAQLLRVYAWSQGLAGEKPSFFEDQRAAQAQAPLS